MAKRLYGHYKKTKEEKYSNVIIEMKQELINNKFLLEDKEYCNDILELIKN